MVRMTLGGSCYLYTHFGEANSRLMSNLNAHRSMSNIFTFSREPYIGSKMNKKPLKIVQKQTQKSVPKCPTGNF